MKSLIVLVVGLLGAGCGKVGEITIGEPPEQEKEKQKDNCIGEYERKEEDGQTSKLVFLDNGIYFFYSNGFKSSDGEWIITDGPPLNRYGRYSASTNSNPNLQSFTVMYSERNGTNVIRELHIKRAAADSLINIYRINTTTDKPPTIKSITLFSQRYGGRRDVSKNNQHTYKKIK